MRHRPIADIERDLQDAEHLLEDIRKRGNAVITDYDLTMGYDADYYLGPASCLHSQVAFYQQELAEANGRGVQLELEL